MQSNNDFNREHADEKTGNKSGSLTLRLSFVMSDYSTAQQMIRFSDEKASFVFLFFGIILSIFGVRGDRILLILGGQAGPAGLRAAFIAVFLVFLGTMITSLFYGLQTITPRLHSPAADPDHHRNRGALLGSGIGGGLSQPVPVAGEAGGSIPATRARASPVRIISAEARPPNSSPSASTTIDFPLPVSPVSRFSPG